MPREQMALHDGERGVPQTIQGAVPWHEGQADVPTAADGTDYRFFTAAEQAFIEPAIDRLIPPDENGPSASQANVQVFLDRQLAGPFGRGDHYYLAARGRRARRSRAIRVDSPRRSSIGRRLRRSRPTSGQCTRARRSRSSRAADQDTVLKGLESGEAKLERRRRQVLLRHAAAEHLGRLFLRPDLRRQQGHGRLEDDRLSRARTTTTANG